jgi:hypothetical protein
MHGLIGLHEPERFGGIEGVQKCSIAFGQRPQRVPMIITRSLYTYSMSGHVLKAF